MKLGVRKKPQIWCLTGLFALSRVTATTVSRHNPAASVGISSAVVAACTSVPIGASIEVSREFSAKWDGFDSDKLVWAAQYQLINMCPVVKVADDKTAPINYLELYPDYTYSSGHVLAGDEDEDDAFELEVEDEFATDTLELDWNQDYWQAFSEAKATMEKYR